ncbi:MAG: MFS transporter [Hyphomonas sp.]|nr:MFS transporter [Hyphomonas sp.]
MTELQGAFDWSRASISLASSIMAFGIAFSTPIVGALTERIHPRLLILFGVASVALSFFALSAVQSNVWLFYGVFLILALLGNFAGAAAVTPILTVAFRKARGTAIGVAMAGIGLGGAVASPIIAQIIYAYGWRTGYITMGVFCLAMLPVIWLLLRSTRDFSFAAHVHHAAPKALHSLTRPVFICLAGLFFTISLAATGLLLHYVPLLTDSGMDARKAATYASFVGLSIIVVRLMIGSLIDRLYAPHVAAAAMILGAAGLVLFSIDGSQFALVGAVALALTFGSEVDLAAYLIAAYFGRANYGKLFGICYAISLLGGMGSTVLYGASSDLFGSYSPVLLLASGLVAGCAIVFLLLPRFPAQNEASELAGNESTPLASPAR